MIPLDGLCQSLPLSNMKMRISQHFRLPLPDSLRQASRFSLPRSFLLLNIIVTAVYTVGISATMYASALAPDLAAGGR
jgi:hypothetical protein